MQDVRAVNPPIRRADTSVSARARIPEAFQDGSVMKRPYISMSRRCTRPEDYVEFRRIARERRETKI